MLDVPLEEILPVSPTSTLKLITSGALSNVMSFLGEMEDVAVLCDSPPLKKKGILLVILRGGGDVIVELEDVVDPCYVKECVENKVN